jgi:hypothetical protein
MRRDGRRDQRGEAAEFIGQNANDLNQPWRRPPIKKGARLGRRSVTSLLEVTCARKRKL